MDMNGLMWTAIVAVTVVLYVRRRRGRLSHEDMD